MKPSEVTRPGFYWWLPEVGHPWRIVRADCIWWMEGAPIRFYHHGLEGEDTPGTLCGILRGPLDSPGEVAATGSGCRARLAPGQWWAFCGETDMGQSLPALCTECGGEYKRAEMPDVREGER